MRTIEDYDMMVANWQPEHIRTYMRTLRNNVRNLEEIYEETREKGPDHTIQAFVDEVGYTDARETIATLILRHAWDGRIGRRTAEWAMSVEDAWDEQAVYGLSEERVLLRGRRVIYGRTAYRSD